MVTGPVAKVWSVRMCGICPALNGIAGIRYSLSPSGRKLLRFLPTRAGFGRDTLVFAAILSYRRGLLFSLLRRPQLRVILNRTADLPRSRRPVAGLAPKGRSLLRARTDQPAANNYEHQCPC